MATQELLPLFGRELPDEIIHLIYEFDPTYRAAFNRCMNQFSKGCYDRRVKAQSYIESRYSHWGYGQYHIGRDHGHEEERMAIWVDNLYLGGYGDQEYVHMDGRYIKPLMFYYTLRCCFIGQRYLPNDNERGHMEEFKIAPGDDRWVRDAYMYTYRSDQRDWRIRDPYFTGERRGNATNYLPEGIRLERLRKRLPIYTDKPRYIMYMYSGKKIKIVNKILKNIKKWEKYNPTLCDY